MIRDSSLLTSISNLALNRRSAFGFVLNILLGLEPEKINGGRELVPYFRDKRGNHRATPPPISRDSWTFRGIRVQSTIGIDNQFEALLILLAFDSQNTGQFSVQLNLQVLAPLDGRHDNFVY